MKTREEIVERIKEAKKELHDGLGDHHYYNLQGEIAALKWVIEYEEL